MDIQILYKFMNNYRQIIHLSKIDACKLMHDSNANMFLRKPISQLKAAFPKTVFKCPFNVKTLLYFIMFNI